MRKRLWLLGAAALFTLIATVAVASARSTGGARDIADAPSIPLNATVTGYLGDDNSNYHYTCCGTEAEFYKVGFQAGDHVDIKSISAGDYAPCADVYAPGVNDFNLNQTNPLNLQTDTTNTNHWEGDFIAPVTGTFVIAMTNSSRGGCDSNDNANQWAYSFVVEAPHGLRIALAAGTLVTGTNHVNVTVRNALNQTLSDPSLTIGLATQWPNSPAKQIARAHIRNGVATFTFKIPKSREGQRVKLIAGGGDNITYVSVSTGRNYQIR